MKGKFIAIEVDDPYETNEDSVNGFMNTNLSEEAKKKVAYENAMRLFKIKK